MKFRLNSRHLRVDIVSYFALLMCVTVSVITYINYRENASNIFNLTNKVFEKSFLFSSEKISKLFFDTENSGAILSEFVAKNIKDLENLDPHEITEFSKVLDLNPYVLSVYIAKENGYFIQLRRVEGATYQNKDRGALPKQAVYIYRTIESNAESEKWTYLDKDLNILSEEIIKVKVAYHPTERTWYTSTTMKKEKLWSDVYIFKTSAKPGFTLSFPIFCSHQKEQSEENPNAHIKYERDSHVSGVLALDLTVESANTFLSTVQISPNCSIAILNEHKKVIASSNLENIKTPPPISPESKAPSKTEPNKNAQNGEEILILDSIKNPMLRYAYYHYFLDSKSDKIFNYEGTDYISYTHPFDISSNKLYFAMLAPTNDFLSEVNEANRKSLLITFGVTLLCMLILYLFAKRISQPLSSLAEDARKIAQLQFPGELNHPTHIREITELSNAMNKMNASIGMFSRYIPKRLAIKLLEKSGEITIGGSVQNITVFFSDIAGFTSISEDTPAEYLTLHLSEYFENLTKIILNNNGNIDKYIGDAIMALWGTPDEDEHQVINACRAALLCQKRLVELNQYWMKMSKPILNTRIGLHTGNAVVGNIGSSERLNFTALGDSVNLAARLEGLNKYYDTNIMTSEDIYAIAKNQFIFRILDKVSVKGKNKSILVYELVDEIRQNSQEQVRQFQYSLTANEAFEHYLNRRWEKAIQIYEVLNEDYGWGVKTNSMIIQRCLYYKDNPPADEWQGDYHMNDK